MACNGCGNCESIGRQVHWEDVRPSLNERLHALCREIPPTAPEFADIEARLHAVYRGFVPGNDEVLDRFVQVTKTAKNDGVSLFAIEYASVTFGWSLNSALPVEVRKKAMTLFCDIYEAATL